ncbi:MAG TPA: TolC family protein, partial [Thermoanaerobaculia bacterium]
MTAVVRFGIAASVALLVAMDAAGQTRITLEDARRVAAESSPALREAAARAGIGSAGRIESWGRLLPSVRLSAGVDRSGVLQRTAEDPITGGIVSLPDSLIEERRSYGTTAMLSLDWTLFDGGQNWLELRRAGALSDAADQRLSAARAHARANATIAYLDALEANAQAEVRDAEARRARTLLDAAETRFRTGAVPEIDMLQASLALNEAELALEDARIEVDAARAALAVYVGSVPDDIVLEAPAAIAFIDDAALDDVAACAIGSSPELAAL